MVHRILLLIAAVAVIYLGSASALAHVEFGHEPHAEIYQDPAVPVPGTGDVPFSDEQIRKYEAALEALRKRFDEKQATVRTPEPVASPSPTALPSPVVLFADSDADGLIDAEETRLGTNSVRADSDGDGTSDKDERVAGRNPLKSAPGDEIIFTTAHFAASTHYHDEYRIVTVRAAPVAGSAALIITGTGPPKLYVALFLASTPQVVFARTDETGRFRAEMPGGVEDGRHEVFVAFTDAAGTVLERSALLVFEKQGNTITMSPQREVAVSPAGDWFGSYEGTLLYGLALLLTVSGGVVIIVVAWTLIRRK